MRRPVNGQSVRATTVTHRFVRRPTVRKSFRSLSPAGPSLENLSTGCEAGHPSRVLAQRPSLTRRNNDAISVAKPPSSRLLLALH
jgi:hypothetical protein